MKKKISLVTGATGHLGYNLSKLLIDNGEEVITTYRNEKKTAMLDHLGCQKRYLDITDKASIKKAFKGVDNVYAVGASFKMWAKNPKRDIYDVNLKGTHNLFEAAAECGIKNIVFVSSVAALDYSQIPAKEANGYNKSRKNWYYNSKNDSDKLALALGKKYGIRTVLILPSAMIGSEAHHLSYSNNLIKQILEGEMIADTNFSINWVDVKDVALGAYNAMKIGKDQERYILSNEKHTSIQDSVKIAATLFPELKLKTPPKVPKIVLYLIGGVMELLSKITGSEPLLQRHYVSMFYGLLQDFDISKAKSELNFSPKLPEKALKDAFSYINMEWKAPKTT